MSRMERAPQPDGGARRSAALAIAVGLILAACRRESAPALSAAAATGGRPEDVALAVNDPDEYAWRLFFAVNRQADPARPGLADPAKPIRQYDPDAPVVWETWALVSGRGAGQAGSEVFRPDGGDPGPWGAWPRRPNDKALSPRLALPDGPREFEIRMNQAGYDFVRGHALFNQDGLQLAFNQAQATQNPQFIAFPAGAQEIKAHWQDLGSRVAPARLARYHWRRIGADYWVLTGFHIATKDLPNWFWADFEQVDSPLQPGDRFADSTTRTDHGSAAPAKGQVEGERRELTGTKWAFYRLRGTQTDFTNARGAPVVMGDSAIEAGFQHTSCMTCHARATVSFVGPKLVHLSPDAAHVDVASGAPRIADRANSDLGPPDPRPFGPSVAYAQTDFVWSLPLRAAAPRASRSGAPPAPTEDGTRRPGPRGS